MWTTMALVAALSLGQGQASQLTLNNVRSTYGFLGPERAENKYLPGDSYFVQFDIENISVRKDGMILYSMSMEVTDAKGKVQYAEKPQDLQTFNILGGTRVPAFATVAIGVDQPPGELTLKLVVTDRGSKASQTLTRKFEVAPKNFGLVRPQIGNGGAPCPPLGAEGQTYYLEIAAIGFEIDKTKMAPNLSFEMRVLDPQNKPTLANPVVREINENTKDLPKRELFAVPQVFELQLNRAGKFTVELKATDLISKKTARYTFPLTVLESRAQK